MKRANLAIKALEGNRSGPLTLEIRSLLFCVLAVAVWTAPNGAVASAQENPYRVIAARNGFGLKPPPPPAPPQSEPPNRPAPQILLTGITTISGPKRAFMKTPATVGTPVEPARPEQFYTLAEGQKEGELEVVQIDEKSGLVQLKSGGVMLTVRFAQNGIAAVEVPPPPSPGPIGAVPIRPMAARF